MHKTSLRLWVIAFYMYTKKSTNKTLGCPNSLWEKIQISSRFSVSCWGISLFLRSWTNPQILSASPIVITGLKLSYVLYPFLSHSASVYWLALLLPPSLPHSWVKPGEMDECVNTGVVPMILGGHFLQCSEAAIYIFHSLPCTAVWPDYFFGLFSPFSQLDYFKKGFYTSQPPTFHNLCQTPPWKWKTKTC